MQFKETMRQPFCFQVRIIAFRFNKAFVVVHISIRKSLEIVQKLHKHLDYFKIITIVFMLTENVVPKSIIMPHSLVDHIGFMKN